MAPDLPVSFQESLAIGVLIGVVVFLLHTFNKWPYFDPWRRKVEGGEEAVTVNGDRSNRGSGETTRQRAGRYVFGAGVLLIVSALYVAEYWRLALWLASIGVIVAFVGAIIQTA